MVVMLVYGMAGSPATLVAHGHNWWTWITLVASPEQRASHDLAQVVALTLHETARL